MMHFVEVVIPEVAGAFHYHLPDHLGAPLTPGMRVLVPFGRRQCIAFFVRNIARPDVAITKPVLSLIDEVSLFTPERFTFFVWLADYYGQALGPVLSVGCPHQKPVVRSFYHLTPLGAEADHIGAGLSLASALRKKPLLKQALKKMGVSPRTLSAMRQQGFIEERWEVKWRKQRKPAPGALLPYIKMAESVQKKIPVLNPQQQSAADEINQALKLQTFAPFLLHGVTGSGKTEVYLAVIASALEQGRGAMLLLPEIALTPQIVARFYAQFRDTIALFHSGLSDWARNDAWWRVHARSARLVIGVRSALFSPISNLGVIIVDEEHEGSYAQEERLYYHARDAALVLARASGAVAVLGSATPSFESFHNVKKGKYRLLSLPTRVDARPLPKIHLVDLRKKEDWVQPYFTCHLVEAIKNRLELGKQIILFINRRGFSPSLVCGDCGYLPLCVQCSVSLTYHRRGTYLGCHYCGFQVVPPTQCPKCSGIRLMPLGLGTEQVEEVVKTLFPTARVARMDRDAVQGTDKQQTLLMQMAAGEIDILVGTQMIAKGHDFPGVTLVGVLCADLSLAFPDFRASERMFQVLTQVTGRAGRGEEPGEAIIQTFQPQNENIQAALRQNYVEFYEREIKLREEGRYPPLLQLILIVLRHQNEDLVITQAKRLGLYIKEAMKGIALLGPVPAPLTRLRGFYRYQILLKGQTRRVMMATVAQAMKRWTERRGVVVEVHINPQNFV